MELQEKGIIDKPEVKKLNFILNNTIVMKRKLGTFFVYGVDPLTNAFEKNLDIIANSTYEKYKSLENKFKELYPQGYETVLKMSFYLEKKKDHVAQEEYHNEQYRSMNSNNSQIVKKIDKEEEEINKIIKEKIDNGELKNNELDIREEKNRLIIKRDYTNKTEQKEKLENLDKELKENRLNIELNNLEREASGEKECNKNDIGGYTHVSFRNNETANEITTKEIRRKVYEKVTSRYVNHESFSSAGPYFEMTIYVFGLSEKGGCTDCKHGKHMETIKYEKNTVKLFSPRSSNDNCLIMAFAYALGIKGNTLKMDRIREQAKVELKGKIHYKNVSKIAKWFNTDYVLLNDKNEIISFSNIQNAKVTIMLKNDHYLVVQSKAFDYCGKCNKRHLVKDVAHVCSSKKVTYNSRRLGKKDYVNLINCKEKEKIKDDTMIFFDLETFQDSTNCHQAYACGYSIGKGEPIIKYGKNCMDDFIDFILKAEDKIITAYNGSGFDFYLLLNNLLKRNIEIKNIIKCNGSILSFRFGNNNKVFDLYKFIESSLDDACKDYNIMNKKLKFDVLKVQSWKDTEKYRGEIEPYLKYDVLSLQELFFMFNDFMYNKEQINITRYVTLSHMAYNIWQSSMQNNLIELLDEDKYTFCRRGTYGARCYPLQEKFTSEHYDDVLSKNMSYEDLKRSGKYIFNADAKSLYPASMGGTDFLNVLYPTGSSRWSEESEKEFKNNKLGYYEIKFKCPKDIRHPILPRKTEDMLRWSLEDGSGVYTNIDITNAINAGYEIEFTNKCLVWDSSSETVFKSYIDKYFDMKDKADKENNKTQRSIAKLLMNALYGKTLQRAIYESTLIINNHDELMECRKDNNIIDAVMLNDSQLMVTVEIKEHKRRSKITKPIQLGGFILAYSRSIMLYFMKSIDPTLKQQIFTYTDTDSLHILGCDAEKLIKLGLIKPKHEAKLGYLTNDTDNDGLIIKEVNLAPKSYFYEYIDKHNILMNEDNSVMKCKGIPKKCLKRDLYDTTKEHDPVEFDGLKKVHSTITKKNKNDGVGYFSIINSKVKKVFSSGQWEGLDKNGNIYLPHGFDKNSIIK